MFSSLFLLLFTSCAQDRVQSDGYASVLEGLLDHSVPEVTVSELVKDTSSIVYLDAREMNEYSVSHLDQAHYVGFEKVDLSCLDSIDKGTKIVVYCSVGYRSEKVAEKIRAKGFNNASNLYGGIFEWVNQGNTVVNENGKTDATHAYDQSWGIWLTRGKKVY